MKYILKNVQVKFVYFSHYLNLKNRCQVNEKLEYFTFLVNATLKIIYAYLIFNVKVINILIFQCKRNFERNFSKSFHKYFLRIFNTPKFIKLCIQHTL